LNFQKMGRRLLRRKQDMEGMQVDGGRRIRRG
jgi:hypothetical protein